MVKICFIGDLMLGRYINNNYSTFMEKLEFIKSQSFSNSSLTTIYGNTLNMLQNCDLLVGNLETTITNGNNKYHKVFNYKLDPKYSRALKINKNTFFNLANNHVLDYNVEGLKDTVKYLDILGIKHAGVSTNGLLEEAMKHAEFNINGTKIGIIGCSDHYSYWKVSVNKPGLNYIDYDNYNNLLTAIKQVKSKVDILILSIHWGPNYAKGVDPTYKKFAYDVLTAGIDIIHGHSSHHVKCVKHYKDDKIVMYGMGDFVNDYAIDSYYRNDLGMIVTIELKVNKIDKIYITPTVIDKEQVNKIKDKGDINYVITSINNDC